MVQNKLRLNPDKSEVIIFVTFHLQSLVNQMRSTLCVGDCVICPAQCVCNLSAFFDRGMTMVPHINQAARGVLCRIRSFSRIHHFLDDNTCGKVVQALAISRRH